MEPFHWLKYLIIQQANTSTSFEENIAQDLKSSLGSIIHITTDGKPVSDNPFIDQADVLPEIYSYGHRFFNR